MSAGVSRPGAETAGELATGGPVEPSAAFVPAGCVMEPLPGAAPKENRSASGNDGPGDLRADLSLILAVAFHGSDYRRDDPGSESTLVSFVDTDGERSLRPLRMSEIAACVVAAGYRRVVVDDTTVERVAKALHAATYVGAEAGLVSEHEAVWSSMPGIKEPWRRAARAAVRAVLEGGAE